MLYTRYWCVLWSVIGLVTLTSCGGEPTERSASEQAENEPPVRFINANPATGTSDAVVVSPAPLALTTNFLPLDPSGNLVGEGDIPAQIDQVLSNVETALGSVDATLQDVVKLNVYVSSNEVADRVRQHFGDTFSGETKPAITVAVGNLELENAHVALDVVAVAPEATDDEPHRQVGSLAGTKDHAAVSVLPPQGHVYVSGQVARGENMIEAMRTTFEASLARLSWMGLPARSIEQVKVFTSDIQNVDTVETALAEYFRGQAAPPIVSLEWVHDSFDIEIEMIASLDESQIQRDRTITYATPPGITANPYYSRIATIHSGSVVYVSGLYGDPSESGEDQIRNIFNQFEEILPQAGTDFNHLAKGQYYVSDWDILGALGTVREEYYEADRPPTSSLIPVRGVGQPDRSITIDLVGVTL
jgi:enamine deaminase RidA (YjgF/YER057c/UK114 family)